MFIFFLILIFSKPQYIIERKTKMINPAKCLHNPNSDNAYISTERLYDALMEHLHNLNSSMLSSEILYIGEVSKRKKIIDDALELVNDKLCEICVVPRDSSCKSDEDFTAYDANNFKDKDPECSII